MKSFRANVLTCISFLMICSFRSVPAMDKEASLTDLPVEVSYGVLAQCPMKTYLDIARLMKLRQVCKLWTGILSNNFIINNMHFALRETQETLFRAIMGRSLVATLREFCITNLYPDMRQHKATVDGCIAVIFDRFGEEKYPDKILVDKLRAIFKKYKVNANDSIVMIMDGPQRMSLLSVCLCSRGYDDKKSRGDVFDLLLSHGLNLSDHTVLSTIAETYDRSIILPRILAPAYNQQVDSRYLFSVICTTSLQKIRYMGIRLGNDIAQLIDVCLQQGMTYAELFNTAAFSCSAPMLKKLLAKTHLTTIDCTNMLNALYAGYCLLSAGEARALQGGLNFTPPHCSLSRNTGTGQYSIEGITAQQHLLLCYQVLVDSGKCIVPQREDDKYQRFFNLLDQAQKTIDKETLSRYMNNMQVSDD